MAVTTCSNDLYNLCSICGGINLTGNLIYFFNYFHMLYSYLVSYVRKFVFVENVLWNCKMKGGVTRQVAIGIRVPFCHLVAFHSFTGGKEDSSGGERIKKRERREERKERCGVLTSFTRNAMITRKRVSLHAQENESKKEETIIFWSRFATLPSFHLSLFFFFFSILSSKFTLPSSFLFSFYARKTIIF